MRFRAGLHGRFFILFFFCVCVCVLVCFSMKASLWKKFWQN